MSFAEIVTKYKLDISEVRTDALLSGGRIDAEYYAKNNLRLFAMLTKKECTTIDTFAKITDGIHASIDFDEASKINLISAKAPKDGYFDLSGTGFIASAQHGKNPRTELRTGDVVISTVGTIGNVAVVQDDILPANSDRHVGIIRIQSGVSPWYLCAFLLSKYGKFQTLREATGNVQLNLFIDKIGTLLVATPTQKLEEAIVDIAERAYTTRQRSLALFATTKNTLLKGLGMEAYVPSTQNVSTRTLTDAINANRFDAEYWQPKYDEVEARIKAVKYATFGELVSWKKGIEVGSEEYQTEGIPFLRISNLKPQELSTNDPKYISEELYAKLKEGFAPRKGEILFSKDGTAGIAHHLTEDVKGITSGGILRLTVKDDVVDADYLTACLNSLVVQMQVERYGGGSIIQHLKTSDAEKILIPILDDKRQAEIAKGLRDAQKALGEAKSLIDTAKRAVEVFIEQDEKAALKLIKAA